MLFSPELMRLCGAFIHKRKSKSYKIVLDVRLLRGIMGYLIF